MDVLMSHLQEQPKTSLIFVSHDPRLASYLQTTVQLADLVSVKQHVDVDQEQEQEQEETGNA